MHSSDNDRSIAQDYEEDALFDELDSYLDDELQRRAWRSRQRARHRAEHNAMKSVIADLRRRVEALERELFDEQTREA